METSDPLVWFGIVFRECGRQHNLVWHNIDSSHFYFPESLKRHKHSVCTQTHAVLQIHQWFHQSMLHGTVCMKLTSRGLSTVVILHRHMRLVHVRAVTNLSNSSPAHHAATEWRAFAPSEFGAPFLMPPIPMFHSLLCGAVYFENGSLHGTLPWCCYTKLRGQWK